MITVSTQPGGSGWITDLSTGTRVYLFEGASGASLSFDETTNAVLAQDLQVNQSQYSVVSVAGVPTLQKNGAAVTIAAASPLLSLQSTILNGLPDVTLRSIIASLWNGVATAQQQQKALAYALLKLKQAGLI